MQILATPQINGATSCVLHITRMPNTTTFPSRFRDHDYALVLTPCHNPKPLCLLPGRLKCRVEASLSSCRMVLGFGFRGSGLVPKGSMYPYSIYLDPKVPT